MSRHINSCKPLRFHNGLSDPYRLPKTMASSMATPSFKTYFPSVIFTFTHNSLTHNSFTHTTHLHTTHSHTTSHTHNLSTHNSLLTGRHGLALCVAVVHLVTCLDLHLALASAHNSFCLDVRSLWLLMLTWLRIQKTCNGFLTDGHLRLFPGYFHSASKCTKCKNARSGAITPMGRKKAQNAEIYQMRIYSMGVMNLHFAWQAWHVRHW